MSEETCFSHDKKEKYTHFTAKFTAKRNQQKATYALVQQW